MIVFAQLVAETIPLVEKKNHDLNLSHKLAIKTASKNKKK
jgi:hypothetical protein